MAVMQRATDLRAGRPDLTHLYDLVRRRDAQYPAAVALGSEQGLTWRTVDSRQLRDLTDRLAAELAAEGVREGDRAVLWVPNTWRTAAYLFALWKLGAIAVPFDREMNPEAAGRIIQAVEPRLVLVGYGERPGWAQDGVTEWWEPGSHVDRAPDAAWMRPAEELAAIFFTSGTTGNPKGCMITQANLCSQVDAIADLLPLDPTCRLASILPLSHLFELVCGLLYPLSQGAAIHYIPSRRAPDILRVLNEQRITHMNVVPQLLTLMGDGLDAQLRAKLPSPAYRVLHQLAPRLPLRWRRLLFLPVHRKLGGHLHLMAAGGAALPSDTQLLWERLGVRVVQGYGASECSPVIACGNADGSTPVGSVGRPIRGVQVRLTAEGELLAKGPNVMRGYWKDPQRTAEVLQDGWYSTGDLAAIDEAGNIRLSGRAKELIVLPSGLNVWPQDIEDVFRSHPAVQDACVIPVPSSAGGVVLHVYLVPSPQSSGRSHRSPAPGTQDSGLGTPDVSAIVAECNGRLAQHQRIATASWWGEPDFPRTSTLKVRRHLLPVPQAEAAVAVDAVLASDDPVAQAIAGAARMRAVLDQQTLGELGLDSLALVDLALTLEEKTGKTVGDDDLSLEMTVAQVRDRLAGQAGRQVDGDVLRESSTSAERPLWPYTWGRSLRLLSWPVEVLYSLSVTRTIVLGGDHLDGLPPRVILAGTHHGFPDLLLVRHGLARTPARRLAGRLVVAAGAWGMGAAGLWARYAIPAFGLYPLRQYSDRDVSLRGLARLAAAGNPVLIFPQGTHATLEEERLDAPRARFKPGVGHLARALDATVVPFGLAGTEKLMPPRKEGFTGRVIAGEIPVSIRRGPLAIAFGAPVNLEESESIPAFAQRLQEVCYALTRQAEAAVGSLTTDH